MLKANPIGIEAGVVTAVPARTIYQMLHMEVFKVGQTLIGRDCSDIGVAMLFQVIAVRKWVEQVGEGHQIIAAQGRECNDLCRCLLRPPDISLGSFCLIVCKRLIEKQLSPLSVISSNQTATTDR